MEALNYERRLRRLHWIRALAFFAVLLVALVALLAIKNLLLSCVIAVMLSYVASPVVAYLEGTGMGRLAAIVVVYCFFISLLGLAIWAIAPFLWTQFSSLRERAPEYIDGTVKLFNKIVLSIETHAGGLGDIDLRQRLHDWMSEKSEQAIVSLPAALSSSASVLFLSPILGFFILKDGRSLGRELLRLVPNNIFELVHNVLHQINQQIAHYIRARLLESLIVAIVCVIGFLAIGFPYAFLLALFAAVANLIPYVGPFFGAAPGIVLALINQDTSFTVFMVVMIYVIAQIIDNFVIIPFMVARIVNLHPITVILVVLLGAQLMGILGMLISIPVASTLKVTFRSVYIHLTDTSS